MSDVACIRYVTMVTLIYHTIHQPIGASTTFRKERIEQACQGAYCSTWLLLLLQFVRCGNYREFGNYGIGSGNPSTLTGGQSQRTILAHADRTEYKTQTDCTELVKNQMWCIVVL